MKKIFIGSGIVVLITAIFFFSSDKEPDILDISKTDQIKKAAKKSADILKKKVKAEPADRFIKKDVANSPLQASLQDLTEEEYLEVDDLNEVDIKERISKIKEIYNMSTSKSVLYIEEIKAHQKVITNWKRKNLIKIHPLETLKPEYAFALGALLEVSTNEVTEIDTASLELSVPEWFVIKRFAESNDLKILMERNQLSSEYVNLENLTKLYSNNPPVEVTKDGQIIGIPDPNAVSEPIPEDQDNVD